MANAPSSADPLAPLRTRSYALLLVLATVLGVPISAGAYFFLALITELQDWVYTEIPDALGVSPDWWPLPVLLVASLIVGAIVRYLPGHGGHSPADGLHAGGPPFPIELPGVFAAATVSLSLGAVIGPEAPLIALGGGLAALTIRAVKRDAPDTTLAVLGACGSFAAVSTLLGSPLVGAFLMMEVSGLGGPRATLVLMPGLLAAGVGYMVFTGLDSWTGLGTFSLAIPDLPDFPSPTLTEFAWAFVIGGGAAILGTAIQRGARHLRPYVDRSRLVVTPLAGLVVGALAVLYVQTTGHPSADVLFSGQDSLPTLVATSDGYAVESLLLLIACKGLAYCTSLSAFRGGAVFPALFIGAAAGIALSHAGLAQTAGIAMGMGAMCATMLRLPLTSVVLATLLVASGGSNTIPLIVVAVVVSFVITIRLSPNPTGPAGAPGVQDRAQSLTDAGSGSA